MKGLAIFALASLLVLAFTATQTSGQATDIVELTDENFDDFVKDGKWLIEFFAPWCGHCKRLAPIFQQAASYAKGKGGLRLGAVDCTVSTKVADRFGIRGYPTIKYFRGAGKIVSDYQGGRDLKDFTQFADKVNAPPVSDVTEASLEGFKKKSDVSFLLVSSNKDAKRAFKNVATTYSDQVQFGATSDASILKAVSSENLEQAIILFNDDKPEIYSGKMTEDDIDAWVSHRMLPLVNEIGPGNWQRLTASNKKLVAAVVLPGKGKEYLNHLRTVAASKKEEFLFGWFDGSKYAQFLGEFGINAARLPTTFILDIEGQRHWDDSTITDTSAAGIYELLEKFATGKIEARGAGSGTFGFLTSSVSRIIREISHNPWLLAMVVVLMMVLFFIVYLACTGSDDIEDVEPTNPAEAGKDGNSTETSNEAAAGDVKAKKD